MLPTQGNRKEEELDEQIKLNKTMKDRIVSMLKGVIEDGKDIDSSFTQKTSSEDEEQLSQLQIFNEDEEEDQQDFKKKIEQNEEEDTMSNTEAKGGSPLFNRQFLKFQTDKYSNNFYNNTFKIERKNSKKIFQTQNVNSILSKLYPELHNYNCFSNNQISNKNNDNFNLFINTNQQSNQFIFNNYFNSNNSNDTPINNCQSNNNFNYLCYNNYLMNLNNNLYQQKQQMNSNQYQTPFPMMPLRTFTFKNNHLNPKKNNNLQNNNSKILLTSQYQNLINSNMYMLNNNNQNNQMNGNNNRQIPITSIFQNNKQKIPFNLEEKLILDLENMLLQKNKIDYDVYNYFKGNFVLLIQNQQASRLCQYYFDNTPEDLIHLIFNELKDKLNKLLIDPYANYFCLKIFYFLNLEDRLILIENIQNNLENLCINKISTYPIQCIIEKLTTKKEQEIITNSIKNSLFKLCFDLYGTHVVEKILIHFEYDIIKPILRFILDNFLHLANNANGLCVVKKQIIIENKKENFSELKNTIKKNALVLIQNPYGNYALQTIIDNWDLNDTEEIMKIFFGKCSVLSLQKYSSNVIERCIEKSKLFYENFINEILINNSSSINLLLQNSFGNYVVQTALKNSHGYNQLNLIKTIENNLSKINDKKLLIKWKSIINSSYMENHQLLNVNNNL